MSKSGTSRKAGKSATLSLHPLTPEQALQRALSTPPPKGKPQKRKPAVKRGRKR